MRFLIIFGVGVVASACLVPVEQSHDAGDSGTVVEVVGSDAGVADAGVADAGVADAGVADAGVADAGVADAGVVDAGVVDAGVVDAGVVDAGVVDAGVADAGVADAGAADAGAADAGAADAGVADAGVADAGETAPQRCQPPGAAIQWTELAITELPGGQQSLDVPLLPLDGGRILLGYENGGSPGSFPYLDGGVGPLRPVIVDGRTLHRVSTSTTGDIWSLRYALASLMTISTRESVFAWGVLAGLNDAGVSVVRQLDRHAITRARLGNDGLPTLGAAGCSEDYPRALCTDTELIVADPQPATTLFSNWLVPQVITESPSGLLVVGNRWTPSGQSAFYARVPGDGGAAAPHAFGDGGVGGLIFTDGGAVAFGGLGALEPISLQPTDVVVFDEAFTELSRHTIGMFAKCRFVSELTLDRLCVDGAHAARYQTAGGADLYSWAATLDFQISQRTVLLIGETAPGSFNLRLASLDTGAESPLVSDANWPMPKMAADDDGGVIIAWYSKGSDAGAPYDGTFHVARICRP